MFDKIKAKTFPILAVFILAINALILAKVAYNKSESLLKITLSERELALPSYAPKENSGLNLRFNYRVLTSDIDTYMSFAPRRYPDWLDKEKMESLGFTMETEATENDTNNKGVTKERIIALEFNGESYQQMLARVQEWHAELSTEYEAGKERYPTQESIDRRLNKEKFQASRLFAIDAAVELEELQSKYAGKPNIIFAKALISTRGYGYKTNNDVKRFGYIQNLSIETINVPNPFNVTLKNLPQTEYNAVNHPRYLVDLEIGKGLEPFVTDVVILEPE